jgi:hypothetical protein
MTQNKVLVSYWKTSRRKERADRVFFKVLFEKNRCSFTHQMYNNKEATVKQKTYYPYSSGTLVPLEEGCGPSPTQKYVSARYKKKYSSSWFV